VPYTLPDAVAFFKVWATAGYHPKHETRAQGLERNALALARAEALAHKKGFYCQWRIDDLDSSEWSDEKPPWRQYVCLLFNAKKECIGSLCGIDFGREGSPIGDPYARVVEAELAHEAMIN
jgi:hypothetical protein